MGPQISYDLRMMGRKYGERVLSFNKNYGMWNDDVIKVTEIHNKSEIYHESERFIFIIPSARKQVRRSELWYYTGM